MKHGYNEPGYNIVIYIQRLVKKCADITGFFVLFELIDQ